MQDILDVFHENGRDFFEVIDKISLETGSPLTLGNYNTDAAVPFISIHPTFDINSGRVYELDAGFIKRVGMSDAVYTIVKWAIECNKDLRNNIFWNSLALHRSFPAPSPLLGAKYCICMTGNVPGMTKDQFIEEVNQNLGPATLWERTDKITGLVDLFAYADPTTAKFNACNKYNETRSLSNKIPMVNMPMLLRLFNDFKAKKAK